MRAADPGGSGSHAGPGHSGRLRARTGRPRQCQFGISDIPKVLAGLDAASLAAAEAVYGLVSPKLTPVSSLETAEATKITENVFRAVNIALVNELKGVYAAMGVDVFEVVDAAATKPFGYMPFYPGPGLGGHCIPIDPFYLAWRAEALGLPTRFVELAGEINATQPAGVITALAEALSQKSRLALNGARVLVLVWPIKRTSTTSAKARAWKFWTYCNPGVLKPRITTPSGQRSA